MKKYKEVRRNRLSQGQVLEMPNKLRGRVLREKLTQLVKKSIAYYGTQRFNTVLIRSPIPRLCVTFHNNLVFYDKAVLAPRPHHKREIHPISAVSRCLFNIFTATLHVLRPCVYVMPVPVAARSRTLSNLDNSTTEIVGSNPARGMDVCFLCFAVLCR
jgi:hypothetical protein